MKTTLYTVFAIIVIIVAITLIKSQHVSMPNNQNTAVFDQSISDGTVTVGYSSSDFALATTTDQVSLKSYIPPCSEDFNYCLYYIGTKYVGTNFESAGIRIQKRVDLIDESLCLSTSPSGFDASMKPDIVKDSWSEFSNVGDAAAGHYAVGSLFRLYVDAVGTASASSTCYEFETRIGQSQFANYPAGAIKEFTTADVSELQTELKQIIDGISVSAGEKGLFQ
jgi:hypothetical protein